ncbi:MAG: cytochrome c oxidase subunit 3 [Myxococcaceae bacterium]|nr:cytochrome c oxidase subunit 3 [Myxococcaceae bacterium]MCI0671762.1 cytochrome c oxidase subunit 3 [Myxococcaceae bacterium]
MSTEGTHTGKFRAEHFGTLGAQKDAAHLGMWTFLATELLLFTGLFAVYAVYRWAYGGLFHEAQKHMDVLLGTVNTFLLVVSSTLVALAPRALEAKRTHVATLLLLGAIAMGLAFLVLKGVEWGHHAHEGALPGQWYAFEKLRVPGASLFYTLYFLMTGLHALHMLIGVVVLAVLAVRLRRRTITAEYPVALELGGMYWHFVDIIWLFLYPLLYLA